jgi:hypothetical protein
MSKKINEDRKIKDDLSQEFKHKELIETNDLIKYLKKIYPDYKKRSLYWVISDYNKRNIINRVSRGFYKLNDNSKNDFLSAVVIGDIKSSRAVYSANPNFEEEITDKIKKDFITLQNEHYKENKFDSNKIHEDYFIITKGDEINFQAQLDNLFFKKILLIFYNIQPAKIRFIMDTGSIYKKEAESFDGLNNQLIWNARDYFNKKIEDKKEAESYTGLIWNSQKSTESSLLNLVLLVIDRWTEKQWEVVRYRLFHFTYKEIAKKIDISPQAINDRIQASNFDIIENALEELTKILRSEK